MIHDLVSATAGGGNVTANDIAAELRANSVVDVSPRTVQRWLGEIGYTYAKKRYIGTMKVGARNTRIRQYILEYAEACREEEADESIIVYVDESYIHTHHPSSRGWLRHGDPGVIGDANGKRLIILHAMSERGLLAVPETVASNWMTEIAETCEVVFDEVLEDGQDDSDYHNTFNGKKFTAWVQCRLLPTFAAMYPHHRMILVMDNASYHKARDESWVSNSQSQTKGALVDQLVAREVPFITTSSGRVVPSHHFNTSACTKADLIAAIDTWLADHPHFNTTVVEKLLADAGHRIIYTPPFTPDVQPIELLWGQVKNAVARQATLARSVTETRTQTEKEFGKITPMMCSKMVKHCHDWIDRWVKKSEAEDLQQCGSLNNIIKGAHLIRIANAPSHAVVSSSSASSAHDNDVVPMDIDCAAPSSSRSLRKRH